MKPNLWGKLSLALSLCLTSWIAGAQQHAAPVGASSAVPTLISYNSVLRDGHGGTVSAIAGVTFLLYKDQEGGLPLWLETQNVMPDRTGHYTVQLGAASSHGLPAELFQTGEARWLGISVNGGPEQPRVLLLSVPYALKAADAETVGGLPASAFVLASPRNAAPASGNDNATAIASSVSSTASTVTTSGGTINTIPLFTTATNIQNSGITQTGSGSSARIGINTTTPAVTLDVKGAETVRGTLFLPAVGTATSIGGKNSQPELFVASVFNSGSSTAVPQKFQWQAEAANNNTSNASATLNLLYGSGTSAPAETGLKINNKGLLTFAAGQTFPGTGPGTVKSVALSAPVSDFTVSGSPVTGSGTLALSWLNNVAPTAVNTASAIVKRDANGGFSAGDISISSVTAGTGATVAIIGNSTAAGGTGLVGVGTTNGVSGTGGQVGVLGNANSAKGYGVYGSSGSSGTGVYGTGGSYGVHGTGSTGVLGEGEVNGIFGDGTGVQGSGYIGVSGNSGANGGEGVLAFNSVAGDGILAGVGDTTNGFAGYFVGNVYVDGNLGKAGGSFKIDHPLDPANKYLYHSFVESTDMMNIYNGNVMTDAEGNAAVRLAEWFEVLNRDFRYQLTVIGQFAQAIVATKIANHQFTIKTDKPNVEVSWQVTGIRKDAWANAHRIPIEESKPERERGFYLHPELFGAPEEKRVLWATHPQALKHWKETRTKLSTTAEKQLPATP